MTSRFVLCTKSGYPLVRRLASSRRTVKIRFARSGGLIQCSVLLMLSLVVRALSLKSFNRNCNIAQQCREGAPIIGPNSTVSRSQCWHIAGTRLNTKAVSFPFPGSFPALRRAPPLDHARKHHAITNVSTYCCQHGDNSKLEATRIMHRNVYMICCQCGFVSWSVISGGPGICGQITSRHIPFDCHIQTPPLPDGAIPSFFYSKRHTWRVHKYPPCHLQLVDSAIRSQTANVQHTGRFPGDSTALFGWLVM